MATKNLIFRFWEVEASPFREAFRKGDFSTSIDCILQATLAANSLP